MTLISGITLHQDNYLYILIMTYWTCIFMQKTYIKHAYSPHFGSCSFIKLKKLIPSSKLITVIKWEEHLIYNHYKNNNNQNELTKTLVDSQDGPESWDMSSNDRDQLIGIDVNQHQLTGCRAYPQCSARLEHHGLDIELGYSGIWILFTVCWMNTAKCLF